MLAYLVMSFVTVRMHVPTGSMIPTIDPKDSFFVDRITYYFRDPSPGDVIVFRHTDRVLTRRIEDGSLAEAAGLAAGERLLYVNAEPIFTAAGADAVLASLSAGDPIRLMTENGAWYDLGEAGADVASLAGLGITATEKRMRYVKRLIAVGGQTVQIRGGDLYVDGEPLDDPRFDRYYYSTSPNSATALSRRWSPRATTSCSGTTRTTRSTRATGASSTNGTSSACRTCVSGRSTGSA